MAKNTLKDTIDNAVKAKYLERLDEFTTHIEDKMGELQHVISINEKVLEVVKASDQQDDPLIKEAIESFELVIKMSKEQNTTSSMKREAGLRLVDLVKSGKAVSPLVFMTDFDKIAGQ